MWRYGGLRGLLRWNIIEPFLGPLKRLTCVWVGHIDKTYPNCINEDGSERQGCAFRCDHPRLARCPRCGTEQRRPAWKKEE